jgi:hypothetical protein
MSGSLAVVAYRSLVEGTPTGNVDLQVRWFNSENPDEIRAWLFAERFHHYSNPEGESVLWELVEIMAIEKFEPKESGEEVIGFIASADSLADLA